MNNLSHPNTPVQVENRKGMPHFQKYIALYMGLLYPWIVFNSYLVSPMVVILMVTMYTLPLIVGIAVIHLLGRRRNKESGYRYGRLMNTAAITLIISGFTLGLLMGSLRLLEAMDGPEAVNELISIIMYISMAATALSFIFLFIGSIMDGRKPITNTEDPSTAKDHPITKTDLKILYAMSSVAAAVGVLMLFGAVYSWISAASAVPVDLIKMSLSTVSVIASILFITLGILLTKKKRAAKPLAIALAVLLTIGLFLPTPFSSPLMYIILAWLVVWFVSKTKILDTPTSSQNPPMG